VQLHHHGSIDSPEALRAYQDAVANGWGSPVLRLRARRRIL